MVTHRGNNGPEGTQRRIAAAGIVTAAIFIGVVFLFLPNRWTWPSSAALRLIANTRRIPAACTQAQVRSILGAPSRVERDPGRFEAWVYRAFPLLLETDFGAGDTLTQTRIVLTAD